MEEPFIGDITMFAGTFAPAGWFFCNGAILPISEYEVLYVLIGTTYGGDGVTTFALPDLRGRVPIGMGRSAFGTTYVMGQTGGSENVTLTPQNLPVHSHAFTSNPKTIYPVRGDAQGNFADPNGHAIAQSPGKKFFGAKASGTMAPLDTTKITLSSVGANMSHNNMQPYMPLHFIIAWAGIFPSFQ